MHTVPVDPPMKSGYVESGIIRVVFHPEQDSEEVEEIAEDRGFHKVEDGVYECDTDGLESIDFPR